MTFVGQLRYRRRDASTVVTHPRSLITQRTRFDAKVFTPCVTSRLSDDVSRCPDRLTLVALWMPRLCRLASIMLSSRTDKVRDGQYQEYTVRRLSVTNNYGVRQPHAFTHGI